MPRHKRGWAIDVEGDHRRRRTSLKVALIEPALLILINDKARHGYALNHALRSLGISPIHPSVVYRTLNQMEELGWIESGWDTDAGQGPPRKVYSLAEQGKSALVVWEEELEKAEKSIENLLSLCRQNEGGAKSKKQN